MGYPSQRCSNPLVRRERPPNRGKRRSSSAPSFRGQTPRIGLSRVPSGGRPALIPDKLGRLLALICSMRIRKLKDHVQTLYRQLKITLGTVDDRLTVYSQSKKKCL